MLLTAIRLGFDEKDSEFKESWTIFRTLNFTSHNVININAASLHYIH